MTNVDSPKRVPGREDDLSEELFRKICRYIYDRARINLGRNKKELVRARFSKVIARRGMSGFREYFNWMEADTSGEALREVMNAISTNLTSFFRESDHFDYLSKSVVPELEAGGQRLGGRTRFRAWSAGCSTGEEIYSMAISFAESVPFLDRWDVKLLATDIDTEVVASGQRGVYSKDRMAGLPALFLKKYFEPTTDGKGKPAYQVKAWMRALVTFRFLNLFSAWPFRSNFDVIFCRNVMIYFDRPTQELLVNRFHDTLAPGGYLFVGHSESLSGIRHQFGYVKPTIYQKKKG